MSALYPLPPTNLESALIREGDAITGLDAKVAALVARIIEDRSQSQTLVCEINPENYAKSTWSAIIPIKKPLAEIQKELSQLKERHTDEASVERLGRIEQSLSDALKPHHSAAIAKFLSELSEIAQEWLKAIKQPSPSSSRTDSPPSSREKTTGSKEYTPYPPRSSPINIEGVVSRLHAVLAAAAKETSLTVLDAAALKHYRAFLTLCLLGKETPLEMKKIRFFHKPFDALSYNQELDRVDKMLDEAMISSAVRVYDLQMRGDSSKIKPCRTTFQLLKTLMLCLSRLKDGMQPSTQDAYLNSVEFKEHLLAYQSASKALLIQEAGSSFLPLDKIPLLDSLEEPISVS